MGSTIFAIVAWVLVVIGVVVIARRDSTKATPRQLLGLLIPWLLLPTVVLIVVSLVGPSPIYLDRYLVMSAPAVAVLAAFGISRFPPIAALATLVVVAAAAAAPLIQLRAPDAKGDWGEVAALVATAAPQGDAVYFSTDPRGDELRGLTTFYPAAFAGLYDIASKEAGGRCGDAAGSGLHGRSVCRRARRGSDPHHGARERRRARAGGSRDIRAAGTHRAGDRRHGADDGLGLELRVDLRGLEPLTPCMPCRCATSCATDPHSPRRTTGLGYYNSAARDAAGRSSGRAGQSFQRRSSE